MKAQDWITTTVVALGVAAVTVAVESPHAGRAGDADVRATVPSLPSTGLTVPSINVKVSAYADPSPGKPVKVRLVAKGTSGGSDRQVPVTITVYSTTMSPMSRVLPPPKVLAKVDSLVSIDSGGNGSTSVDLPLTWSEASPAKSTPPAPGSAGTPASRPALRMITRYQMALSSSLGGRAAPADLESAATTVHTASAPPQPAAPAGNNG